MLATIILAGTLMSEPLPSGFDITQIVSKVESARQSRERPRAFIETPELEARNRTFNTIQIDDIQIKLKANKLRLRMPI